MGGKELLEKAPLSVLCFLEVNREPTEHLLGELREAAAALQQAGMPLYLALPNLSHRDDPTLRKALAALPWATVCQCDFSTVIPALGRRLYLDPDRLPPGHFGQPAGRGPVRLLRLQRGHGPAAAAAGRRAEKP